MKDFFPHLFFDKKKVITFLIWTFISSVSSVLFPVVTQVFIRYVYPSHDVSILFLWCAIFLLIFLVKLLFDVHFRKYYTKYFLKLEKNMQEKIFSYYMGKNLSFELLYRFLVKDVALYVLYVRRFLFSNFIEGVKVVALIILMLFFDKQLVMYSLWFFPLFFLYVFFFRLLVKKNERRLSSSISLGSTDIIPLLHKFSQKKVGEKAFRRLQSQDLQKQLLNRNSLVGLNESLRASITFYRILFLTYFGFFIISAGFHLGGLIVGLLYITILLRSCSNLLRNSIFYIIGKRSVRRIHARK